VKTTLQAQSSNTAARAEVTKYYAFNGSRAAMRQANNEVFYLFGDHLGSSSLVVDWQGRKISEMRYAPWGETRWAWELDGGEGYSNRLYTSQIAQDRNYVGQLYDYGARFLNVRTGQFISPDSLIDGEDSSTGYNRFLYAHGNPIRNSDPTGHCVIICTALMGAVIGAAFVAVPKIISNLQQGSSPFTNIEPADVLKGAAVGFVGGATMGFGLAGGAALAGLASISAGSTGASLIGGGIVFASSVASGQASTAADNLLTSGSVFEGNELLNTDDMLTDGALGLLGFKILGGSSSRVLKTSLFQRGPFANEGYIAATAKAVKGGKSTVSERAWAQQVGKCHHCGTKLPEGKGIFDHIPPNAQNTGSQNGYQQCSSCMQLQSKAVQYPQNHSRWLRPKWQLGYGNPLPQLNQRRRGP
jgi:RHS repeat-associated protein